MDMDFLWATGTDMVTELPLLLQLLIMQLHLPPPTTLLPTPSSKRETFSNCFILYIQNIFCTNIYFHSNFRGLNSNIFHC